MRSSTPAGRDAKYGPVAMFLHWAIAALIITAWLLPHTRKLLPHEMGAAIIGLHRSVGMTVLILVLLRVIWRFVNPPPALPGGTAQLIRWLSHAGHASLYLLMVAVPAFGMLYSWAGGHALSFWGLVSIPAPAGLSPDLHGIFRSLHVLSANAILWLAGLHTAAALVHQYVFKDGLLDRMLPERIRALRRGPDALI